MTGIPESSKRLQGAARALGVEMAIRRFPEGTKTAEAAARAIGCPVSAIVKSLVFVVEDPDGRRLTVLALVPGDRRLDTDRLARVAGGVRSVRATLDEVRDATGYAAGGTPPFGHATRLPVFADEALRRHEEVWAAGGTPDTVFPITVSELERSTGAVWAELS